MGGGLMTCWCGAGTAVHGNPRRWCDECLPADEKLKGETMKPFVEMTLRELLDFLQNPATKYQVEGQPWPLPLYTSDGERAKYGGVHPEGCYVLVPLPCSLQEFGADSTYTRALIWLQLIGADGYKDKNQDQVPSVVARFTQAEVRLAGPSLDVLVRAVIHEHARQRGYPIPPWPYPWPRPESHWDTDGPRGGAVEVVVHGTEFLIEPSGEDGPHTGRGRFKVTCRGCGEVLHHSTTGVTNRIESHRAERHPRGFVLRGVVAPTLISLDSEEAVDILRPGDYFVFPEQPRVNRILRWEGVGKIPVHALGEKGRPAILDDGYTVEDVVALVHPKLDELKRRAAVEREQWTERAREVAKQEPTSIPEPVMDPEPWRCPPPHPAQPSRARRSRPEPHQWSWETLERSYTAIITTLRWAHRVALCKPANSALLDVWIQSYDDAGILVFVGALEQRGDLSKAFCDDQLLVSGAEDACIQAMIELRIKDWKGGNLAHYVEGLL